MTETLTGPDALPRLAARLGAMVPAGPCVVGLDGGGGAGKTTLARALAALVPALRPVHLDDFYRPPGERPDPMEIGAAYDWRRLEREVLAPLAAGRPARYRRFDWPTGRRAGVLTLSPGSALLVEGVTALRRSLRPHYALTIWLEAPEGLRRARGLARDGDAWAAAWAEDWLPQERAYHAAERPWEEADVVLRAAPA
ncbi:MAG TPA: uridine kinase [Alphaproteobacteria bacterium]|nr:uridine kinase [Alphaproteobacteria bacterium]